MDIVIATKNDQRTIYDCLKSLKDQTLPCKIILVDGNSTDETRKIAEEFGAEVYDEPITPNIRRSAEARNEGLKHSTSELVGFVDADAVFPLTWAEDLSKYLTGSKTAGVTSGCEWKGGSKLSLAIHRVITIGSSHARGFKTITELDSIATYNAIYRREALDSVDLFLEQKAYGMDAKNHRPLIFDESLGGCEDWELNHRLRKAGYKLIGVPESPAEHRERSTVKGFRKQMFHYAWARARVTKLKKIYTLFHAVPSIALLSMIVMLGLLPLSFVAAFAGVYLCVVALTSVFINVKSGSDVFALSYRAFGLFIILHFAWAFGYLKGWVA